MAIVGSCRTRNGETFWQAKQLWLIFSSLYWIFIYWRRCHWQQDFPPRMRNVTLLYPLAGNAADSMSVVDARNGAVLSKLTILKEEPYPGLQKMSLPVMVEGAPNFRQVRCQSIYRLFNRYMNFTVSACFDFHARCVRFGLIHILSAVNHRHSADVGYHLVPNVSRMSSFVNEYMSASDRSSRKIISASFRLLCLRSCSPFVITCWEYRWMPRRYMEWPFQHVKE